jgi:hypothetical protein
MISRWFGFPVADTWRRSVFCTVEDAHTIAARARPCRPFETLGPTRTCWRSLWPRLPHYTTSCGAPRGSLLTSQKRFRKSSRHCPRRTHWRTTSRRKVEGRNCSRQSPGQLGGAWIQLFCQGTWRVRRSRGSGAREANVTSRARFYLRRKPAISYNDMFA